MNGSHALELVISAKDAASATLHALVAVIGSELVGALGDAARAEADQEASVARLTQAYANAGRSGADLQDAQDAIKESSDRYGFTNQDLQNSLSGLITLTRDNTKALDLQALAMDVAHAKNIDLDTATKLIERTYNGSANAAERYGFHIRDGSSATQALAQIQQQAAGQAEAYAETNAAGIDRMKNAIAEWKEGVGAALGPAGQMLAILPGISAGVELASAAFGFLIPRLFGTAAAETAAAAAAVPTQLAFDGLAVSEDAATVSAAALDIALAPLLAIFAVLAGTGLVVGIEGASVLTGGGLVNPLDYLPHFGGGGEVPGVMGQAVPIVAHAGEEVVRADQRSSRNGGDINLNFAGAHIYGMNDFETQVATAVRNVKERGGFRGVLA